MVVTGTGMDTEIGSIATLLNQTEADRTPLQKQLDRLTQIIVGIAGIAFVTMVLLGIRDDQPFDELFLAGVALAISAIPTGLPAVVTTLYSMGTRVLAEHNAIVKRLPSVETLGSVSAICSDKTGTLTLNKMTARELVVPGRNRFTVSGEGYATTGEIRHEGGLEFDLTDAYLPMALCADARLEDDGELIGDPTEGALIVLAAKGGIDVDGARARYPRVAEVPFDSDYKFMATFHRMTDRSGSEVIRCFVKGAPDVLIARSSSYWSPDGDVREIASDHHAAALAENERMASSGERVMVVARRDFDPDQFDPGGDLLSVVQDLTIIAMVGIVDPPRAEAKAAIAKCHSAGIEVRMITGDHAVTAAAIGRELGIGGRALTGAEFAALTDEELAAQLPDIGVVARVAPEDKIRLVHALQKQSNIVAMTGDGVNDAPALKKADIGVAMGITGTEVSKDAAVMILTDDNFATIVRAIEYGRELYDNLSKYIRFQMAVLVGFIATFLGAAIFSIADGIPFSPLAVLWINFVVQVPIAIALGFDKPLARADGPQAAAARRAGAERAAVGASRRARRAHRGCDALGPRGLRGLGGRAGRHDHGRHRVLADERGSGAERTQSDADDVLPGHRVGSSAAHALRRHAPGDRPGHRARGPQPDPRHDPAHRRAVAGVPAVGRRPRRGRGGHQGGPPAASGVAQAEIGLDDRADRGRGGRRSTRSPAGCGRTRPGSTGTARRRRPQCSRRMSPLTASRMGTTRRWNRMSDWRVWNQCRCCDGSIGSSEKMPSLISS